VDNYKNKNGKNTEKMGKTKNDVNNLIMNTSKAEKNQFADCETPLVITGVSAIRKWLN